MSRHGSQLRKRVIDEWSQITIELQRMRSDASVRPDDGYRIFREAGETAEAIQLDFGPVVFSMPERATHHTTELFVAITGQLRFNRTSFVDEKRLVTHDFATRVGYFRRRKDDLEHVYGAHYDCDIERLAHPTFHGQL